MFPDLEVFLESRSLARPGGQEPTRRCQDRKGYRARRGSNVRKGSPWEQFGCRTSCGMVTK